MARRRHDLSEMMHRWDWNEGRSFSGETARHQRFSKCPRCSLAEHFFHPCFGWSRWKEWIDKPKTWGCRSFSLPVAPDALPSKALGVPLSTHFAEIANFLTTYVCSPATRLKFSQNRTPFHCCDSTDFRVKNKWYVSRLFPLYKIVSVIFAGVEMGKWADIISKDQHFVPFISSATKWYIEKNEKQDK